MTRLTVSDSHGSSNQARRLLRIEEVASILDVSRGRAYELARAGILPVVRLGRQLRVDPRSLDAFLQGGGEVVPDDECPAAEPS